MFVYGNREDLTVLSDRFVTHCTFTFLLSVFRSQLPRSNEFYSYDPPPGVRILAECKSQYIYLIQSAAVYLYIKDFWTNDGTDCLFFFFLEDEPPSISEPNQSVLPISGVKLCWVCGCAGSKACSRCHTVTYCGKHHQTLHWKHTHKRECCSQGVCHTAYTATHPSLNFLPRGRLKASSLFCLSVGIEVSTVTTSLFLFPESELVTEPEEEEEKDTKEAEKEEGRVNCPSLADSKHYVSDNWLLVLKLCYKIKQGLKKLWS